MEEQYIAGKHPVLEALRSGRPIHKIWIADHLQKNISGPIVAEAKAAGIPVLPVDKRKLEQMAGGVQHQGVVAQAAAHEYVEFETLIARAKSAQSLPLLLMLDEIEDPHNLGSVLRTADCAGVHGVIIPRRRSAGLTAAVFKASAGAAEYVPVAKVTNLAQTIDKLKAEGIWGVAGADAAAQQEVYSADLNVPLAVVIGNESKGLGRLIKEKCDFLIKLPMHGRVGSLNASVAAALITYEAVRQRSRHG